MTRVSQSVVTMLQAGRLSGRGSIPFNIRDFSFLQSIQINPGTNPSCYSIYIGELFSEENESVA